MPFCPSCRTEYQTGTTTCSDCNEALVAELAPDDALSEETVDVFVCFDAQVATRVVGILTDGGVEGMVRDRSSSAFPMNVGIEAKQIIAVAAHDAQTAADIIAQAVEDGVLPAAGQPPATDESDDTDD
jgi:hypothetical protein